MYISQVMEVSKKYLRWMFTLPLFWMAIFFIIPFILLLKISFSSGVFGIPPYTEILTFLMDTYNCVLNFTFANYVDLFDPMYVKSLYSSCGIAVVSTIGCLVLGYPLAYAISRYDDEKKLLFLVLIFLPFWTSFLIRVYAWISLLSPSGILNNMLLSLHVIREPINFANNICAVCIGIIYTYLPFMILPLYSSIEKLDRNYIDAAYDLGCTPIKAFFKITIPLTTNGIMAGSLLVFLPALGEYLIPELLGSSETLTLGRVIWNDCFENISWPTSAALAIVLVIIVFVSSIFFENINKLWGRGK